MLARFFIDRPVLAWVISLVIVLLGGIASALLPIAQYPDVTPPAVRVTASSSWRERAGGSRYRRRADRAADRRRRQHVVHVVAKQPTTGRTHSTSRSYAGTDINLAQVLVQNRVAVRGASVLPRRGQSRWRNHPEAVAGHSPDRSTSARNQSGDQQALLRHACTSATTRRSTFRTRWHGSKGSATFSPSVVKITACGIWLDPGKLQITEPNGRRCDSRFARAERPGRGRAARPAAGSARPGLPVHDQYPRSAGRTGAVQQHHRRHRYRWRSHLPTRRCPR